MATIQGVYLALFGRPADPLGLAFFNSATNNGANLAGIGPLQSSAEYQSRFTGQSNVQIINSIYQSLFNRDADLPGLTFFSNALANGTLSINSIAIAIYDGAQGADLTMRNLKEAAANAFTTAIDTSAEVLGYNGNAAAASARAFIAGVTTTAPTAAAVTAAVAAATTAGSSGTGGTGAILTLTAAADVVDLTQTNVSLKSTAGDDTIRALTVGATDDLSTSDVINGGGGIDTLNATVDATAIAAVLNSVEKVNLTTTVNGAAFDLGAVTGLTDFTITGGFTATVSKADGTPTYGIINGAAAFVDALTVTFTNATGANDSVKLVSTNNQAAAAASFGRFTIDNIENAAITINGTGTGVHNVDIAGAASTLKVVTISGTGSSNVVLTESGNQETTVTTVDASGLKGGLTFNSTGFTKIVTINGGQGADTITSSGAATGTVKITGGTGADSITLAGVTENVVFKAGDSSLTGGFDTIVNFTTATDKVDLSAITLTNKTLGTSALGAAPSGDIAGFYTIGGTQFGVAKITFGGDTYYAVDANNNNNFDAGTDLYFKATAATLVAGDFIFG